MSEAKTTSYVTTPIYYVNDRPHLGHVYTTMVADVIARHHRLRGDDTFFLTGTDEHAAKIVDAAKAQGLSTQECVDRHSAAFQEVFARLEMTHDDFLRTSEERHKEKVTRYMRELLESGDVYPGQYVGWYDPGQEEYVTESRAKAQDYVGEISGKPLERREETNYFFRLSAFRNTLLEMYEARDREGAPFVKPPARKNEILNRIKEAEDVPISRTGSGGWGIPIPGDETQTIYVWIDALFNYLTTVDVDERRHYWRCGAVHFIAKDILWFHAAIWPALLIALGRRPGYEWVNLPRQVYSHSYWVSDSGVKMSKSLGNFLDPGAIDAYVEEFGLDALRYFLATRGPLGVSDSAFNPELFTEVYNADLANTFGNACSRVTNMIGKYFGGRLPEPGPAVPAAIDLEAVAEAAVEKVTAAFDRLDLKRAGEGALELVRAVNGYVEQTEPFRMAKDEARLPEVGTVLGRCLEALRIASVLLAPFLPDRCAEFWRRIGQADLAEALANRGTGDLAAWARWGRLLPGTVIEAGKPLFPRYQK